MRSVAMQFPLRSAFLAIPLEGDAKARFQALQQPLADHSHALSLQNPDSPHLTLYFWPSVLKIEWEGIRAKAAEIAGRTAPFTLQTTGVETFGDHGRDRVLFLSVAFSPELAMLKKLCPWPNPRTSEGDAQAFHPHVTLARVRHPERFSIAKKKILKSLADAEFDIRVDRIRLYADVDGAKQTPLEEFAFAA